MKADIHPTYYPKATVKCACGANYTVGSTKESYSLDICSACHPFYTGKQKLVDTAGRVDKFMARQKVAAERKVELETRANKKTARKEETLEEKVTRKAKEKAEKKESETAEKKPAKKTGKTAKPAKKSTKK